MTDVRFRNDRFKCLDAEFLCTIIERTYHSRDLASREVCESAQRGLYAVTMSPSYANIWWRKRTVEGDTTSDMIYHYDLRELIPYAYERNSQVEGTHDWNPFNNDEMS